MTPTPRSLVPPPASTARRVAALSLVPIGLAGGFAAARALLAPRHLPLPLPFEAELGLVHVPFGRLAFFRAGAGEGVPLLLIHSVNAAASSYEMKPLVDRYRGSRPIYTLDLPGFGFSDRLDRIYTPRLMTDAILAIVETIRARHGAFPLDAIALSLSCEFLARAAVEHPPLFRSLGLVSPTGLDVGRRGAPGAGKPALRDVVSFPLWGRTLYDGLVSRPSLRFFLRKTWGSSAIDEGLLAYDYVTAHQPGAEHAPFSFLAGFLFSGDALDLYRELAAPVWLCRGMRGDFVDRGVADEVSFRPNWTVQALPTGALPHFEKPNEVAAAYDAFRAHLA